MLASLGQAVVLRHMRRDVHLAQRRNVIAGIVGLVFADRDSSSRSFGFLLEHRLGGTPLGGAAGLRDGGRVPQGHWKTITFVAALRRNGMRAPCTVDGSMNGAKFLAYVEQCLAPHPQAQGYRHDRQSSCAQSCWHTRSD